MSITDTPSPSPSHPAAHPTYSALVAFVVIVPSVLVALAGLPFGHSYLINIPWFIAFEDALAQGAWVPRHLPALWDGTGGLDFFFYGPLPFYFAAGPARLICPGCEPTTVLAIAGGMMLGLSGLSFLVLARRFLTRGAALAAMAAYMLMPYHLWTDWFIRQAFTEFASFIFLPLIVAGAVDILRGGRGGSLVVFGWAGAALCHLPVAMLFGHVVLVPVLLHALIWREGAGGRLARLAVATGAGLLVAGAYWVPALLLLGDVTPSVLWEKSYYGPVAWLLPFGGDAPDRVTGIVVSIALLAALGLCIVAAVANRGPRSREITIWFLGLILPSAFMMTAPSAPIWEAWILDHAQFPYRLLVVIDMAAAVAFGSLVLRLAEGTLVARLTAGVGVIWLAAVTAIATAAAIPYATSEYRSKDYHVKMIGVAEYLAPAAIETLRRVSVAPGATGTRLDLLPVIAEGVAAARSAGVVVDVAPRRIDVALPDAEGGAVTVPSFHWKHWRARTADGAEIPLRAETETGFMVADVPPGTRDFEIVLPVLRAEWIGLAITLAGLLAWAGLAWTERRRAAPSAAG